MADLKQAYRALDPAAPAASERYVVRPGDPMGLLAAELQIRETPKHVLVGGQRGVGKTTELLRLQSAPLGVNLSCELMALTGREMSAGVWKSEVQKRVLQAHSSVVRQTSPWHVRDFPPTLEEDLKCLSENGPFVLAFDGLEKVDSHSAMAVLESLSDLPCSVIVIVPLSLLLSPSYADHISGWDQILSLPAISTRRRDGTPDTPGVTLLRAVVVRRVGSDVFTETSLDLLIDASAGIHRELLVLAQQACLRAAMTEHLQVRDEDVRAAIEDKRQELSFHLTPADIEYLAELRDVQRVTSDPRVLPLLSRNLIVSYHGDWTWFDVHPLIKTLLPQPRTAQRAAG